ncbi:MAG TPA: fasciclin domain-containing protein [Gammaproteobacteria bacterium]|nr:fasciclin domain-containing protein [Gammaproteobacteria bacterium]
MVNVRNPSLSFRPLVAFAGALVLFIAAAGTAVAGGYGSYGNSQPAAKADLVDTAAGAGDFSTLVTAIKAAGLENTLRDGGPYTVFAPTNAAFAKLPAGALQSLLDDPQALAQVLTYHVVPGRVMAADVMGLSSATTVEGRSVAIGTAGGVTVNQARVVKTDILASNGVIHVIDSVLLPE